MSSLTQQAQQGINPAVGVGKLIEQFQQYEAVVAQVMPKKGMEAKRILALCAQVFKVSPHLHQCDPASIVGAVIQCALTGLNPHPQYGEVYFVPYGGKVQLQFGYKGWGKLAYKGGIVTSINAFSVYEGDEFAYWLGLNPGIKHVPGPNFGDASKLTHAYGIVALRNGETKFRVLNKVEIERLRCKSPMQKPDKIGGAWATDYDRMAEAKAVKQTLKTVPMEDEWRDIYLQDEALAPSVTDYERTQSGKRMVEAYEYPQEPPVEVNADVETKAD